MNDDARQRMSQASKHYKQGEYEQALSALEGVTGERADKARAAIQRKLADAKPKKKDTCLGSIVRVVAAVVISIVLLLAGLWVIGIPQREAVTIRSSLWSVCRDVFEDDYYDDSIDFDQWWHGCWDEVDAGWNLHEDEIRLCYGRSEGGVLKESYMQCLVDTGFQFSGAYIYGYEGAE